MTVVPMSAALAQAKQPRKMRSPNHRFYVDSKPWEITPVCIAPVLPGETLKNLMVQSRVVTAPILSTVVGWWCEYFFFYVKHRQMPAAANHVAMALDANSVLAPSAANAAHYYGGFGYDWVGQCLETVVNEWFREAGETYATGVTAGRGGRPLAKIAIDGIHESLSDTTTLSDGGALGANQEAQERNMEMYEYMRAVGLTRMTYEEWLATYGVNIAKTQERDRPELLRYVKEWTYPSNTVEGSTGVPTAAASWGIAERADKDRYFDEPGFIFGVQVLRPKIYLGNQTGFGASALDRVFRWLPALMRDDPSTSLAEFTTSQGPFGKSTAGFTNGYWLDVRDLFIYGDQFLDGISQSNSIALPTIAQVHRYATEAMGDALFPGATKTARADGVVSLKILGTQSDFT